MRNAVVLFVVCLGWLNLHGQPVYSTNVVADVNSYTGRVVQISGVVQSVEKDGLSASSYVVVVDGGLRVRVFIDRNQRTIDYARARIAKCNFDNMPKPSIGSKQYYAGFIKKEMGKVWLITEKPDGLMR